MDDTSICYCGHVLDEHGGDHHAPNALACTVKGCHCVAFEHNPEATEDADEE